MRAFIFVSCLALAALAHPAAAYSFSGIHLPSGLPQNVHTQQPHVHQQLPAEHSFADFAAPQMIYGTPETAPASAPAFVPASAPAFVPASAPAFVPASAPAAVPNDVAEQFAVVAPTVPEEQHSQHELPHPHQHAQQDSYNMAHQHSAATAHETGYPYAPAPTQVHKHIYVHVPPKDFEEEDAVQPRVIHQGGPKQKHYKIVFIKAPAAPAIRAPIVPPAPQNEEKTLIYVLHKKPETQQDIVIPTAAPTTPSKPEVYFIKYKTKKEEAPVYGPPPPSAPAAVVDMEPRHVEQPSAEYGGPIAAEEEFAGPNVAGGDLIGAPITTIQPALEQEQQQQQFVNELTPPAEVYGAPTMAAFVGAGNEETTLVTPNNQYLAPAGAEATPPAPIVVAEQEEQHQHLPASNYGPPQRFFIKKRK